MKEKGISETELAEMSGMSQSTINRFFNLKFCLRMDYVLQLFEALEIDMEIKVRDKNIDADAIAEEAEYIAAFVK